MQIASVVLSALLSASGVSASGVSSSELRGGSTEIVDLTATASLITTSTPCGEGSCNCPEGSPGCVTGSCAIGRCWDGSCANDATMCVVRRRRLLQFGGNAFEGVMLTSGKFSMMMDAASGGF